MFGYNLDVLNTQTQTKTSQNFLQINKYVAGPNILQWIYALPRLLLIITVNYKWCHQKTIIIVKSQSIAD